MKALTLTQPWATLVALEAKRVETRSWPTHHRGPLAIHAAKGLDPIGGAAGLELLLKTEPFATVFREEAARRGPGTTYGDLLPFGRVVAIVELDDVVPTEKLLDTWGLVEWMNPDDFAREKGFGDYSPGRFGWLLRDVRPLVIPLETRGYQGLWDLAGVCRACGCTDDAACEEGCYWVEADLCSACRDVRAVA